ncbi:MAG: hypothetical protein KDM91_12255 [Verrucomicrobiae bacterium]|nr:hypothetical protein [Verrucomicrobiae bacterium]
MWVESAEAPGGWREERWEETITADETGTVVAVAKRRVADGRGMVGS